MLLVVFIWTNFKIYVILVYNIPDITSLVFSNQEVSNVKAEKIPVLLGIVLIILLAFLIVWQADILGVSANRLEQDARENQDIQSDWEMAQDVNDEMCAMLFYDEEKEECAYSIYLSRDGLAFGYFFRQGGSDAYMTDSVKGVVFEDKGIALLSMNEDGVCKIVADSDEAEKVISVDPREPFAVVLPVDCTAITMYDAQENIVTLYDTYTGI